MTQWLCSNSGLNNYVTHSLTLRVTLSYVTCRLAGCSEVLSSSILLWLATSHCLCCRFHPQEARLLPQLRHHLGLCSPWDLHFGALLWLHYLWPGSHQGGEEEPPGDSSLD